MRHLIADGVRVQCCVTSPPYYGLRDYGHPGQLGLEQTPAEYVDNMVEVFGLVRDLLADDGVLWLNLGDSYSVRHVGRRDHGTGSPSSRLGPNNDGIPGGTEVVSDGNKLTPGFKPKDILGIPWRVAFALQEDGWYLRQDVIWSKPNPMPESVKDRCTSSHEYLFLLAKGKRYYYDADAIREPHSEVSLARAQRNRFGGKYQGSDEKEHGSIKRGGNYGKAGNPDKICTPGGRNKRSVWTIPTRPYSGAHFAVFPEALVEPCILSGSRPDDLVLDPFMGSGTVAGVAQRLGRKWIGCELNPEYEQLQKRRTDQLSLEI